MSAAEDKKGGGWAEKIPPAGLVLGLLLALGCGGGLAVWAMLSGMGAGIMNFGDAKRHYPEVVMGFIMIGFIVAAFVSSRTEKKGGGDQDRKSVV